MNQTLMTQIAHGLDWLLPRVCYGCHNTHHPEKVQNLCMFCWEKTYRYQRIKLPNLPADIVSAGIYEDLLKKIVTQSKFKRNTMCTDFAEYFIRMAFRQIPTQFDYITAVPSDYFRSIWRGIDLPGTLAQQLSMTSKIEFRTDLLQKDHRPKTQRTLNSIQREQNMKNVFKASRDIFGKRILVIDDIITTGNTLTACYKAMKRHKPAQVTFLTIAKTRF